MDDSLETLRTRVEAMDHLLKATIAALAMRDPEFLKGVAEAFMIGDVYGSPISDMRAEAWAEISRELGIIRDLVSGDDAPAPSGSAPRTLTRAH